MKCLWQTYSLNCSWAISHINYGLMHNISEIWGLLHEATDVTSNKLTGEGVTRYK